jgi:hypothetical protein
VSQDGGCVMEDGGNFQGVRSSVSLGAGWGCQKGWVFLAVVLVFWDVCLEERKPRGLRAGQVRTKMDWVDAGSV